MTRTNDRTKLFVILGLGANLSDPLRQLERATALIGQRVEVERVSSVYVTEPVGFADQPDFYNLVLSGITDDPIYDLHAYAQEVEARLGRESQKVRNGPRAIDIDLLAYGELVLSSAALIVPHPRMLERRFVLAPLVEILPEWRHPQLRQTAEQSLGALTDGGRVELFGPLTSQGGGDAEEK